MRRLIEQTLCGHEGALNPATNRPLDGMESHPVGVVTGYNRGGGRTFESHCPGGSSREVTVDEMVLALHCKRSNFDPTSERIQFEAKHCHECADEIAAVIGVGSGTQ